MINDKLLANNTNKGVKLFPDYTHQLIDRSSTSSISWTATKDCFCLAKASGGNIHTVVVNDNEIQRSVDGYFMFACFYVKQGDRVAVNNTNDVDVVSLKAFGLKS